MPTRMIDGDALWRSDKLTQVQPPSYRAEYANMIPLALADGYFECNPRRVWADVYSYNRPDITVQIVEDILDEFERVGLISRKSDEKAKVWGFWVGIEKRLPCDSQRDRYKQGKPNIFNSIPVAKSTSGPNQDDVLLGLGLDRIEIGKEGSAATSATELYGQAKRVYRRYVGKSLGSLGPRAGQWQELVSQHGDAVLAAVELWAQEGGKGLRNVNWPLAVFLKNAEEFIEAVKSTTAETAQQENELNSAARAAEEGRRLAIEERDKDLQRIAEEEQQAENFTI